MRYLRILLKVLRLPHTQRRVVLRSAWLMIVIDRQLSRRGYYRAQMWLERQPYTPTQISVDQAVWLTQRLADHLVDKDKPCLRRALVLAHILRGEGYPARLHIGFSNRSDTVAGHAWVELNDRVLGDDADVRSRFSILKSLSSGSH